MMCKKIILLLIFFIFFFNSFSFALEDIEELKFFPAEFDYISGIDFKVVINELKQYKKISDQIVELDLLRDMTLELGIDVFSDVDYVLTAGKLAPTMIGENPKIIIVIRGNFDKDLIYKSFIRTNQDVSKKFASNKVYLCAGKGCLFIYDRNHIIISDKLSFETVIKVIEGKTESMKTSQKILNYIETLNENIAVWNYVDISPTLKSRLRSIALSFGMSEDTIELINALKAFSMTIEVLENVYTISTRIVCIGATSSKMLADLIRSYVAVFKSLLLPNISSLAKFFEALQIQNISNEVIISFTLLKDDAHKMVDDFRVFREEQ